MQYRLELDTIRRLVKQSARSVALGFKGRGIGLELVVLGRCRADFPSAGAALLP